MCLAIVKSTTKDVKRQAHEQGYITFYKVVVKDERGDYLSPFMDGLLPTVDLQWPRFKVIHPADVPGSYAERGVLHGALVSARARYLATWLDSSYMLSKSTRMVILKCVASPECVVVAGKGDIGVTAFTVVGEERYIRTVEMMRCY